MMLFVWQRMACPELLILYNPGPLKYVLTACILSVAGKTDHVLMHQVWILEKIHIHIHIHILIHIHTYTYIHIHILIDIHIHMHIRIHILLSFRFKCLVFV